MNNTFPQMTSLSLVIPAYNDETTIGRLIADSAYLLAKVCPDYEIVVINDGSRDNTPKVISDLAAKNNRIRVINHEVNRGYGSTIRELYLLGKKDVIFSLPGDYQYAPKELLAMAKGLQDHDFVIGLRVNRNDPWRRKVQSKVYNLMLRVFYGHRHQDVNSIKLFKRSILDKVILQSQSPFVDAELCIRAEKAGFKVIEIPIEHLPRTAGGASGGKVSVITETFADLISMRASF
jgi:glycosyltransferase involved in cell wall biosynthesis